MPIHQWPLWIVQYMHLDSKLFRVKCMEEPADSLFVDSSLLCGVMFISTWNYLAVVYKRNNIPPSLQLQSIQSTSLTHHFLTTKGLENATKIYMLIYTERARGRHNYGKRGKNVMLCTLKCISLKTSKWSWVRARKGFLWIECIV